jgi:hypothetical protein
MSFSTSQRRRWLALVAVCVVAVVGTTVAVVRARDRAEARSTERLPAAGVRVVPAAEISGHAHLIFRSTALDRDYGRVEVSTLEHPASPVAQTSMTCDRVAFESGRGICLVRDLQGVVTTTRAIVFDSRFRPLHTVDLAGYPSRTTVSPDGRWGATTTFVNGDSYATMGAFSVRTNIIDLRAGAIALDLEKLSVRRDGDVIQSPDFNFWGVTFAADNRTFYATLGTGGRTFLVKGDRVTHEAEVVHPDVECPSLSPDNRRIAFKHRISGEGPETVWRLSVLDLATMTEHPLAERSSVDDQAAWLDDDTVMYGLVSDPAAAAEIQRATPGLDPLATGGLATDTWVVPADGSGAPRRLRTGSWSTHVVRPQA